MFLSFISDSSKQFLKQFYFIFSNNLSCIFDQFALPVFSKFFSFFPYAGETIISSENRKNLIAEGIFFSWNFSTGFIENFYYFHDSFWKVCLFGQILILPYFPWKNMASYTVSQKNDAMTHEKWVIREKLKRRIGFCVPDDSFGWKTLAAAKTASEYYDPCDPSSSAEISTTGKPFFCQLLKFLILSCSKIQCFPFTCLRI